MTYLRYSPDIGTLEKDEQESIAGIIKGMTQQTTTVEKREHHAVRASHAKSSGLVLGELRVAPNLPPELAQGLFATPATYPVAVRFAQGPGETLGDRVSTHRGMSVKVFDAKGEKIAGHTADSQDFVFTTGTTFPSGTAKGFLRDAKQIGAATPLPEGVKSAVSATMRGFNKVLHAIGTDSAKAGFFGHPYGHPLADAYFSQCPMRFGDYVAKLGFFPVSGSQSALKEWKLAPHQDADGFRHAVVDYFKTNEGTFELRAQLWVNAKDQPIEDASVEWSTKESDYVTVAVVTLPRQNAYSAARQQYFDEKMTFRPAHSLMAHRPLGSVMRARLQVYQALADFRHRENGIAAHNPTSVAEIPS